MGGPRGSRILIKPLKKKKQDELVAAVAPEPYKTMINKQDPLYSVMETNFESIDRTDSETNTIEQQITKFFTEQISEGPSHITMIKINLIGQMIRMGASLEEIQPVIYQNLVFQDIRKGSSPFLEMIDKEIQRLSPRPRQGQYQMQVEPMIIDPAVYTGVFDKLIESINNNYLHIPNREKFKKLPTEENRPISIDDYLVTIDFIIAKKMFSNLPVFLLYDFLKFNQYLILKYSENPIYNPVDDSFHVKVPENGFTDIKPILERVIMFKNYFKFLSDRNHDSPQSLYHYLHCLMLLRIYIPLTPIEITREHIAALNLGGKSRNKRGNKKTNRRKTIRRRKNKSIRHKSIRRKTIRRKER